MSLRSKILILFVTLALAPLLAVGINDYVQSTRLVTSLVESQLALVGERAARAIGARYLSIASDLRVLAESRAGASHPRFADLTEVFQRIEVRSSSGELIEVLKDEVALSACERAPVRLEAAAAGSAGESRVLVGLVPVDRLLAGGALVPPYGASGYTLVVDRATGGVLYDPRCRVEAPFAGTLGGDPAREWSGRFRFSEDGSSRTAAFVNLGDPPWTVVTTTVIHEFTVPEGRAHLASLLFVLFLALVTAGGFAILITHIMRSLEEVSSAATRIGEGDFTPWLPPPGDDEVGRLTLAIGAMVARLRATMGQLERSRQMAVVGEMASHLSHEVRNPLSSIRLNLQSVEREVRNGSVPADLQVVLQLCLREISRLDRVVNNVLRLGRSATGSVQRLSLHRLIDESLEVVEPQLRHRGIRIERDFAAARDEVSVDGEQLSGALLNLYLNAADAMPDGGTLGLWTETAEGADGRALIRAHVCDEGVGVPPELRDRIFKPFFTTKSHGSGIGLPLAVQAADAHGGRLYLEKRSELERGAEFVLELPLAAAPEPAVTLRRWETPVLTERSGEAFRVQS